MPSPKPEDPAIQIRKDLAIKVRKDAAEFDENMRVCICKLDSTRAREISSKADYLKTAETEGSENESEKLMLLREETRGLAQEADVLFDQMFDMLKKHHTFLSGVAVVLDK